MTMTQAASTPPGASISSIWWLFLLQGIAGILFGAMLITAPAATLVTLVTFLGFYWLFTGVLSLVQMFVDRSVPWIWTLLSGILGIVAGFVVLRHPLMAAVMIPTFIVIVLGIEALIMAGVNIVAALKGGGFGSFVLGIVNLLLGFLLLSAPTSAALAVPLVFGIILSGAGCRPYDLGLSHQGRMTMPDQAVATERRMLVALIVCAAVLAILFLQQARQVFAPLAFALLAMAIVWPVQRRLQTRLPKLVALAISALLTSLVVAVFVSMIAWGFGRVARYTISEAAYFQSLFNIAASWLDARGIVVASLWAEHFNMSWIIRLFQEILGMINGALRFSLIVLIYVVLGLLEIDVAARKLATMHNRKVGQALLTGISESAVKLRRYMAVRTLMSVATGLLVWAFAYIAGLRLAAEWGVIAFALNYIPFIGPFVATMFPTIFAVAQFQSWEMAMIVFACLNLIQFMVGSYIEPRIAGKALAMSPFLVLFAVFFWTSIWAFAGTFIGVPMVIVLLTICSQFPSCRWVNELFGESPDEADSLVGKP